MFWGRVLAPFRQSKAPKPAEATNTEKLPWEIIRDGYTDIGMIASTWSILERFVDLCIWKLAELDPTIGACLTSQIQSVRAKLIALETLAHTKGANETALRALRKIQNESEDPARRRNRIVHNPLYETKDAVTLNIMSGNRKLIMGIDELKFSDVQKLHGDIHKLIDALHTLAPALGIKFESGAYFPQPLP